MAYSSVISISRRLPGWRLCFLPAFTLWTTKELVVTAIAGRKKTTAGRRRGRPGHGSTLQRRPGCAAASDRAYLC